MNFAEVLAGLVFTGSQSWRELLIISTVSTAANIVFLVINPIIKIQEKKYAINISNASVKR